MLAPPDAVIEDGKMVGRELATVDIDELERKARESLGESGAEWHEGRWLQHIAANSPPVTLALIARVRELNAALVEVCDVATTPLAKDRQAVLRARGIARKGVVLS